MSDRPKPSGTISFLFTDIEGSTRNWQAHGAVMGKAVARHDELMRQSIAARHGHVFKTIGDAFCAAFATTADALAAAVDAQQALAAEPWEGLDAVRARMAIHVGVAEERDDDYFGPAVNRVARLLAAGHGGQVLLSLPASELIHDSLLDGIALRDLGEHRLKDLDRPEHIFQVIIPRLPSEFGPLKTVDARPNNLPLALTPFVGRAEELARIQDTLLRPEVRLLTLLGPGGIGKTRLALQAAAELIDAFPQGAFFVPLASITDPDSVVPAIAEALKVRDVAGQSLLQALRDHLRNASLLLVLDNFEQVLAAAAVLPALLRDCSQVKFVVTSRSVLRVSGEHALAVEPLEVPGTDGDAISAHRALASDAVRLFAAHAKAVRDDFELSDENAPAVVEICRRLDGLPLAIELAAARVRMLTPQAMLPRLESRLKLLTGGGRDLPERQQTLHGAIAWSYDLLPPEQKLLLARMSVFVRGATFEAGEAVCSGLDPASEARTLAPAVSAIPEIDVFEGISALVDHSLLRQIDEEVGVRFAMLETIREFGMERLVEAGETGEIRRRHALYFLDFAERTTQQLAGPQQAASVRRFDAEHDNLRSAIGWALDAGHADYGLRLGRAMYKYWQIRGFLSEGRSWLERILAQCGDADRELRARVLGNLGNLANELADYARARSAYEQSLAVWREMSDQRMIATALNNLGHVLARQGEYALAQELQRESLSVWESLGDRRGLASLHHNLGVMAHDEGDLPASRQHHEEALAIRRAIGDHGAAAYSSCALAHALHHQGQHEPALALYQDAIRCFREAGDRVGLAQALGGYADVACEIGRDDESAACFREALQIWREVGPRRSVPCLEAVAVLASNRGHAQRAVQLLAAAQSLRESMGVPLPPATQAERRDMLDLLRIMMGNDAYETAWTAGSALEAEAAIASAMAEIEVNAIRERPELPASPAGASAA